MTAVNIDFQRCMSSCSTESSTDVTRTYGDSYHGLHGTGYGEDCPQTPWTNIGDPNGWVPASMVLEPQDIKETLPRTWARRYLDL